MIVTLSTNHGDIKLELNPEKAPKTCANFVQYVKDGHFTDTIFHRVIPGFMIQGGGFTADMNQKATRDNIENEAGNGLTNMTGTIAMARTPDPHSASCQFFINLSDNAFLNFTAPTAQGFGYCVFGTTIEGMDVVQAIEKVATGPHGPHQDVPIDAVIITSATVEGDA